MPLVMAHKLQKFFCDGDTAALSSHYDRKTNLEHIEVEVTTRDKRRFTLCLELSPQDYKNLINEQLELAEKSSEEIPLGRKPKTNAAAPPRVAAEATPPKAPPSVGFSPPTKVLATERQQLSKKDPREKALLNAFIKAYPDRFFKRKKMTADELKEREQRTEDIEIARSYILSGDRTTVEKWIRLLEDLA